MNPATQAAIDALRDAAETVAPGELSFATSADAALRVMKAVDNPDIDLESAAKIVAAEPLLSAKVMQLANSAALNPGGSPVKDLRQAVMRIGMAPIRSLAMALTLDQLRRARRLAPCRDLANRMWERSIHVAALAYVVAGRMSRLSADDALLAGVVHDLGRFYLLGVAADRQPSLLLDQRALMASLDALQPAVIGPLLRALGLPVATVDAVCGCDRFRGAMPPETLADVLFLACWLAPPANPFEDPEQRDRTHAQEGAALGLDRQTIGDFVTAAGDEIYSIVLALEA